MSDLLDFKTTKRAIYHTPDDLKFEKVYYNILMDCDKISKFATNL